jgi:tetratricopeptide (TPR) repeat protein
LGDGLGVLRILGLVVGGLALGGLGGLAVAPKPPKPPTTGPEAARVKLAEARKLLVDPKRRVDSTEAMQEAIVAIQAAIALDERYAEARRDLGILYARQGKFDDAAREYELYLELWPKAPDAVTVESMVKKYRGKKP